MNAVSENRKSEILKLLEKIECEREVRMLYACESGSRAWGFESKDSDYDVRFVYVRERDWYLSIDVEKKRDVIELPIEGELDVNGWDLRKTLQLLLKSNPPLMEWLSSPIVYLDREGFADRIREIAKTVYHPTAVRYHYFSMAKGNYREFLRGESVIRKKYLYVLRPLLAVEWIERGMGMVPTEFQILVDRVVEDEKLRKEIDELLVLKRAGKEMDRGAPFPAIHSYVESTIKAKEKETFTADKPVGRAEELNELFRFFVTE